MGEIIKGHATIELTDVNTGDKQVIEEDNIVTNSLQKIIKKNAKMCSNAYESIFGSNDESNFLPLKRATGGILLYDGNIDEDPDIMYAPNTVSLVGCGSGISYNGANTMAGSYNKVESGAIENGYKHVWDFGTSQANGSISCVCLTSQSGGKETSGCFPFSSDYYAGVGESDDTKCEVLNGSNADKSYAIPRIDNEGSVSSYSRGISVLFIDAGKRNILIMPTDARWCYTYLNSSDENVKLNFKQSIYYKKSIDLAIMNFDINKVSLFDKTYRPSYNDFLKEVKTVEMPEGLKEKINADLSGSYFLNQSSDDENIYFILRSDEGDAYNLSINGKLYVWKINVDTFKSTYYEVTNTTGESIHAEKSSSYNEFNIVYVFKDKLICSGVSNNIYIIDITNNTSIKQVKLPTGDVANFGTSYKCLVYRTNGNILADFGERTKSGYKIINIETGVVTYANIDTRVAAGTSYYGFEYPPKILPLAGTDFYVILTKSSDPYAYLQFESCFLVTINNLSSPVLKTSAQTMKITYTLTKASS